MHVAPMSASICNTVVESYRWPQHGKAIASRDWAAHRFSIDSSARLLTLSSGCTGIGGFELGARAACAALGVRCVQAWAIECNRACIHELLNQPRHVRPQHLFR
eukprot:9490968-Pyramimonas_sp.AAC.1